MYIIPYSSYRFLTCENHVKLDYEVKFSFKEFLKYVSFFDVQFEDGDPMDAVTAYTGLLKGVYEINSLSKALKNFLKFVIKCVQLNVGNKGFNFEVDLDMDISSKLMLSSDCNLQGDVNKRYELLRGEVYEI